MIRTHVFSIAFLLSSGLGLPTYAQFNGTDKTVGMAASESLTITGNVVTLTGCDVTGAGTKVMFSVMSEKDGNRIHISYETRAVDSGGVILPATKGTAAGQAFDLTSRAINLVGLVSGITYPMIVEFAGAKPGNPLAVVQLHDGNNFINFRSAQTACAPQ